MPERVIFRKERNGAGTDGVGYLAVFPDDPANAGNIACVPFYFVNDVAFFEPYTEVSSLYYYYQTRIVHEDTLLAGKLLQTIKKYYDNAEFEVRERMNRK